MKVSAAIVPLLHPRCVQNCPVFASSHVYGGIERGRNKFDFTAINERLSVVMSIIPRPCNK